MAKTFVYDFSSPTFSSISIGTGDNAQPVATHNGTYYGYAITSISGSFNGEVITGLYGASGTSAYDRNGDAQNNTIFRDSASGDKGYNTVHSIDGIDSEGIAFTTLSGHIYNVYEFGNQLVFDETDSSGIITSDRAVLQTTNYSSTVCYASGTLIRTPHGDVAVEHLSAGDLVITASGEHRPIRWLGHRIIDCRRASNREDVLPVRISAGAFGPARPARDLYLSRGHAVCVTVFDEVMIPAGALINGATVEQVDVDTITYWHVELDSHDAILAENLACESYMDAGNRSFFVGAGIVALAAHPDAAPSPRHDEYRHPLYEGGALVEVVRERMRARALALGWSQQHLPFGGLHLLADGVRIEPYGSPSGTRIRFVVPASTRALQLISPVSSPLDLGADGDGRRLGVCIGTVTVDDGLAVRRTLDLAGCAAADGFHAMEAACRWTTGASLLPSPLWQGSQGLFFLTIELAHTAPPRWQAPRDNVVASCRSA